MALERIKSLILSLCLLNEKYFWKASNFSSSSSSTFWFDKVNCWQCTCLCSTKKDEKNVRIHLPDLNLRPNFRRLWKFDPTLEPIQRIEAFVRYYRYISLFWKLVAAFLNCSQNQDKIYDCVNKLLSWSIEEILTRVHFNSFVQSTRSFIVTQ